MTDPVSQMPEGSYLAKQLLVTGCYRSGTTLLEKLLHSHPSICVGSQPFPILYFFAKTAFLQERGLTRRYPLDHLFLEQDYEVGEFAQFLVGFQLTEAALDEIFQQLANYRLGLWTPQVLRFRSQVRAGAFPAVYRQLHELLARLLRKPEAIICGSKEVLCEEYVPFVLSQGGKAILSVRDPRDMITSLDYRERDNSTGEHRPLLFSLRAWRKSVALILAHEEHRNFHWVRYEDLVRNPAEVVANLTRFLGVSNLEGHVLAGPLADQYGRRWQGNSSFSDFEGISTDSVGKYRTVLAVPTVAYVETCCRPEMERLGYVCETPTGDSRQKMRAYREPFAVIHAKFGCDYSWSDERVDQEIERLDKLDTGTLSLREARTWFIDPRAYDKLRRRFT